MGDIRQSFVGYGRENLLHLKFAAWVDITYVEMLENVDVGVSMFRQEIGG